MIKKFIKHIKNSQRILITTHHVPDADGIGSQIALFYALQAMDKNVTAVLECPLLQRYHHLDLDRSILCYEELPDDPFDLMIILDTHRLSRVGSKVSSLEKKIKTILFMDHHPAPSHLVNDHCIDASLSSTGELVGHFLESLKISFTKEISLALYTAILVDTNSFRYPTVTSRTHRLVAKLMLSGIDTNNAYNQIYKIQTLDYMKLLGDLFSQVQISEDNQIAWIAIEEKLLQKFSIHQENTHSLVNHLFVLKNIKIVCMFREEKDHIKVSLRTFDTKINIGIMAKKLGGGGHRHSAAFYIRGSLKETTYTTIQKLCSLIKVSDL